MVKTLFFFLAFGALVQADTLVQTLESDTITSTVSYLTNKDLNVLTCTPGEGGDYPTSGELRLLAFAVEMVPEYPNDEFWANLPMGMTCDQALQLIHEAVDGKEVVEVQVTRKLEMVPETLTRVRRKTDGEVIKVQYYLYESLADIHRFKLAGFEFPLHSSAYVGWRYQWLGTRQTGPRGRSLL